MFNGRRGSGYWDAADWISRRKSSRTEQTDVSLGTRLVRSSFHANSCSVLGVLMRPSLSQEVFSANDVE